MPDQTGPSISQLYRNTLDTNLRGYLDTNANILTVVKKPAAMDDIDVLSAQGEGPPLFNNINEFPGFRLFDIFVKYRQNQCRVRGVYEKLWLTSAMSTWCKVQPS